MSDAYNDISRDSAIYGRVGTILYRWLRDENYQSEMETLKKMSRGYFCSSGWEIAERLESDMKSATTDDKKRRVIDIWGYDMLEE